MNDTISILHADDNTGDAKLFGNILQDTSKAQGGKQFDITHTQSIEGVEEALKSTNEFAIYLLDGSFLEKGQEVKLLCKKAIDMIFQYKPLNHGEIILLSAEYNIEQVAYECSEKHNVHIVGLQKGAKTMSSIHHILNVSEFL